MKFNTFKMFLFLILLCSCGSSDRTSSVENWEPILKEMEIIMVAEIPDSVKAAKIQALFQQYQIELADYDRFYREAVQEEPSVNIQTLKEIESLLSTDMKDELTRQRKEAEERNEPRRPQQ